MAVSDYCGPIDDHFSCDGWHDTPEGGYECDCNCHDPAYMEALDIAAEFNREHPVGTAVTYWPGVREGDGIASTTRGAAWVLASGDPMVLVEGYAGGIALTHVEVSRGNGS